MTTPKWLIWFLDRLTFSTSWGSFGFALASRGEMGAEVDEV